MAASQCNAGRRPVLSGEEQPWGSVTCSWSEVYMYTRACCAVLMGNWVGKCEVSALRWTVRLTPLSRAEILALSVSCVLLMIRDVPGSPNAYWWEQKSRFTVVNVLSLHTVARQETDSSAIMLDWRSFINLCRLSKIGVLGHSFV